MKKNIFAVCDLEVDYALNFMDYLNHKKNIPFEIQAFTNVESLIAYGKMNHIELLLISQKAMCRQVQELEIGKIVILSEGVHPPDLDRYPSVYKYQASSDVVREVMACYGAEKAVAPAVFSCTEKDHGNLCSIFSVGALPENIVCTYIRTDSGKRKSCSLSESGGILRL